jgi:hypothetical protein
MDPSPNNRFDVPIHIVLAGRIAGTQGRLIWVGYSGSDPEHVSHLTDSRSCAHSDRIDRRLPEAHGQQPPRCRRHTAVTSRQITPSSNQPDQQALLP